MLSLASRFWSKVDRSGNCWVWTGARHPNGYGKLSGGPKGAGTFLAHRVAWELANGPIPQGLCVCHVCDVHACVRSDHLFLGTQLDNMRDAVAKGHCGRQVPARGQRNGAYTHPEKVRRGESHAQVKLSAQQVREIREAYVQGTRIALLAREYRVSWSNVKFIVAGRTWKVR